MLSKEDKLEVLELIREVLANTNPSRHEVVKDDDYGCDCIYTIRKSELIRSINNIILREECRGD